MDCSAAKNLAEILYKNGYTNLHYFPGGWKEYNGIKHKKKWSTKRKKNVNCKNPRGFSNKQYCKYGKKKSKRRTR